MPLGTVHTHKNLDVWKKSIQLVLDLYRMTVTFPDEERFGLTSQIRRAAASIPANIAEGCARGSTKEYVKFLAISRGSAAELETHVFIASKLGYLGNAQAEKVEAEISDIARMLNRLISALKAKDSSQD